MPTVASAEGGSILIMLKRRASAVSRSMKKRYSDVVVHPMQAKSPRASAALKVSFASVNGPRSCMLL
jgi:hypothetical protein